MSEALASGRLQYRSCSRRRTEANERFFQAEAERIARLCHRMAERFARGGRLVAVGSSDQARSDVRHVAVEFVHPVIVGKRALPAIGLTGDAAGLDRQVELLARPDDVLIAFGPEDGGRPGPGAGPRVPHASPASRSTPSGPSCRPRTIPFVAQELAETLYHVLWELCHVFFDHRGLLEGRDARTVHDTGASSFLYPFLAETQSRPRGGGGGRARARC